MAALLMPWGVPPLAARLYGYLLLSPGPASLDRITADLSISKSSASVAARLLEKYMLARRLGEKGSKRALYEVSDNYAGMIVGQNRLLDDLGDLLGRGRAGADPKVAGRLAEMAAFYAAVRQAMDAALRRWRKERS